MNPIPFPASVMAGYIYEITYCNLHMSNIKEDELNDHLKGNTGYDWLFHVKLVLVTLRAYYQSHQDLAIKEREEW